MLVDQGVIGAEDGEAIWPDWIGFSPKSRPRTSLSTALEDIHMNVENRLREIIGAAAGRLHTATVRNDQVATI